MFDMKKIMINVYIYSQILLRVILSIELSIEAIAVQSKLIELV